MAIDWSAEYPGQIGVYPGWPYGKPRNISVPGDGTGTPLEAAWVSDLAGWQAALLTEAGITPSGDPDKVGASDYVDAIKAIAGANLTNFTSTPHNWTALQSFTGGYIANNWGVSGEVLYVDGVTGGPILKPRTTLHMLRGVAYDGTGKSEAGTFGAIRLTSDAALTTAPTFASEVDLPEGAVLTGWRMLAFTALKGGGTPIRGSVRLNRFTPNFAGLTGTSVDIGPTVPTTGNMTGELLSASGLSAAFDAASVLRFLFTLTVPDDLMWIDFARYGYELTWLDPGPRNF